MAKLTYNGFGVFYDPTTDKTWREGETLDVSAADVDRLLPQGRFVEGEPKTEDEVEIASPIDAAEAAAAGELVEAPPGPESADLETTGGNKTRKGGSR